MSVLFSRLLNNIILSKEVIFLSNVSPAEKKKKKARVLLHLFTGTDSCFFLPDGITVCFCGSVEGSGKSRRKVFALPLGHFIAFEFPL